MAVQPAYLNMRTALYDTHLSLGARMVPFAGWEMPIQHSGILAEARAVRSRTGIFDTSHMGRILFAGKGALQLLQKVLTADVEKLRPGRARYSFVLNEQGGIIDDVIVYRLGETAPEQPERFFLVCNASNRETVLAWLRRWSRGLADLRMQDITLETAMVAFQGPGAAAVVDSVPLPATLAVQPSALKPFGMAEGRLPGTSKGAGLALVARTGYTGEDGFEFILPEIHAAALWRALMERGAVPCGLGARDVLRLEAALMLHGNDIDPATTPLEAGQERFVALDKESPFIGQDVLRRQQAQGLKRRLVGFQMLERGIPRHGYAIKCSGQSVGSVTSGGYSPTLDRDIGMGYVAKGCGAAGTRLEVDIRGRGVAAEVVPLPFYSRKR